MWFHNAFVHLFVNPWPSARQTISGVCALKTCAVFLSIILRETEAEGQRSWVSYSCCLCARSHLIEMFADVTACKCVCAFLTNNTLAVSRKIKIISLALFIRDGYICCFETKSQTCSHLRWLMSTMLKTGIKQLFLTQWYRS